MIEALYSDVSLPYANFSYSPEDDGCREDKDERGYTKSNEKNGD